MAYSLVHITNSTAYDANGTVSYASAFCSDDQYSVKAGQAWQATSRGVCLVTQISAYLSVGDKTIQAASYESSGTSYSQYAIIQIGPESFAVTRITQDSDSLDVGTLEAEPTTAQK